MLDTPVRDRFFKTVILTILVFSIVVQFLVSAWFYDKLKMLDNRLSQYPMNKPVEVDLKVTIPELVEINQKIDRLSQRLDKGMEPQQTAEIAKPETESKTASKPVKKAAKSNRSHRVDVVEEVRN